MNIVLLIVDSLRACSLGSHQRHGCRGSGSAGLRTPFLDRLEREAISFRRAYATECWTLPTHMSLFTGRLPSEHGAHFQHMAYGEEAPTIAERLAAAGHHTEVVTRNFVFDGTIPGVTRGFQQWSRPLADLSGADPMALFLALAKPRVRRHIQATGFFHPRHAEQRAFVRTFAQSLLPADERALARVLDVMEQQRRVRQPYFICCNLYDVHAPYAPARDSLLRPWTSLRGVAENLAFPLHQSKLGQHAYLRDGFRLSAWAQRVLRERYHRAIELMDAKLAGFHAAARAGGLLDDTLLIVTSDHGEAFGEHGLYLHDASVYDTHLHVPLWVQHPALPAARIDDVVSMRALFSVMLAAAGQHPVEQTILEPDYRARHPIAMAEHFFYPHRPDMALRYRQNLLAVVVGEDKFVARGDGIVRYDLARDPDELAPVPATIEDLVGACRRSTAPSAAVEGCLAHVRRRQAPHADARPRLRRAA